MQYDPVNNHRRSIRLKDYDYTQAGAYFVTVCTQHWACVLGDVIDDEMQLSVTGTIVAETWEWLAQQYPYVILDAYVVMPNHVHGIIVINNDPVGAAREPHLTPPTTLAHTPRHPQSIPATAGTGARDRGASGAPP